jgi:glycosyltransferase involved in cell wall biosynthesis
MKWSPPSKRFWLKVHQKRGKRLYREKKISLVIPARNEEKLIQPTLEHVPELIDKVYVINDGSTDRMADVVREIQQSDSRIELINHEVNQGVGQGIITGYLRSAAEKYDVAVVVGGDYQMDLAEVEKFLDPIIDGEVDYTKGNRFTSGMGAFDYMPKKRLMGNMLISAMTKIASGYYKVVDVVDGYTAISRLAIESINWDGAWKGYGYPMDFLIQLNMKGFKIKDIPRTAIYLEGERQSQIKGMKYALKVSPMLIRGFFWRIINKYAFRNFHPLIFFYFFGLILVPLGLLDGLYLCYKQLAGIGVSGPQSVLAALMLITGVQFLLFAMLFDMQESH